MKLASLKAYALEIPFVEAFRHSTKDRRASDALVVKVVAEDGSVGFGEGLARPYVTGETQSSALEHIEQTLFARVRGLEVPEIKKTSDLLAFLDDLAEMVPVKGDAEVVAYNAARSALELALVDCALRASDTSLAICLPPKREIVTYSGVITAGSLDKVEKLARQMKLIGLQAIKVKVGLGDDLERLNKVREIVGSEVALRIDANGIWSVEETLAFLERAAGLELVSVEQPIPRSDLKELALLQQRTPVPIMVDESLITESDAEVLIRERACQLFNVRISKCGGLGPCLRIIKRALEAGIGIQIGSQVGETAILSAAGRHLAAWVPEVFSVEGSFGGLLLAQDLSRENMSFGFGGEASVLRGPGLGMEILEERLQKYAL